MPAGNTNPFTCCSFSPALWRCLSPQAERINLLKQAVEKYGNGKKDDELTPCVILDDEDE